MLPNSNFLLPQDALSTWMRSPSDCAALGKTNQAYSFGATRPQLGRKRWNWAQARWNSLPHWLHEPCLILGGCNWCWELELETNQIKAMSHRSVPAAVTAHTSALPHRYKTGIEESVLFSWEDDSGWNTIYKHQEVSTGHPLVHTELKHRQTQRLPESDVRFSISIKKKKKKVGCKGNHEQKHWCRQRLKSTVLQHVTRYLLTPFFCFYITTEVSNKVGT